MQLRCKARDTRCMIFPPRRRHVFAPALATPALAAAAGPTALYAAATVTALAAAAIAASAVTTPTY